MQQHVVEEDDFPLYYHKQKEPRHEDVPTNTRFSGVTQRNFGIYDDTTTQIIDEAQVKKYSTNYANISLGLHVNLFNMPFSFSQPTQHHTQASGAV